MASKKNSGLHFESFEGLKLSLPYFEECKVFGRIQLSKRSISKWATVDMSEHKAFKANEKAAFTISTKLSTLGVMGHIMSDQTQVRVKLFDLKSL